MRIQARRVSATFLLIIFCAVCSVIEAAASDLVPESKSALSDRCHFDHQTVTLPHDSFLSIQQFFMDKNNSSQIDATWENEESQDFGGQKGFLKFSDGTYLEIWDSSKMVNAGFLPADVGFQDACRPKNSDTIFRIAKGYGVKPTEARYKGRLLMALVGRRGMAGDPNGGMFFMWHADAELDRSKFGIQRILKNVPGDIDGTPNSNLVSDYRGAGLKTKIRNHVLRAVDNIGVDRIAVAHASYPLGPIAIRFSRGGKDSKDIQIPKSSGSSEQFLLQVRPGYGALVLQLDSYKTMNDLLAVTNLDCN